MEANVACRHRSATGEVNAPGRCGGIQVEVKERLKRREQTATFLTLRRPREWIRRPSCRIERTQVDAVNNAGAEVGQRGPESNVRRNTPRRNARIVGRTGCSTPAAQRLHGGQQPSANGTVVNQRR
eukprot:196347-Prymnesium_polylepis.2